MQHSIQWSRDFRFSHHIVVIVHAQTVAGSTIHAPGLIEHLVALNDPVFVLVQRRFPRNLNILGRQRDACARCRRRWNILQSTRLDRFTWWPVTFGIECLHGHRVLCVFFQIYESKIVDAVSTGETDSRKIVKLMLDLREFARFLHEITGAPYFLIADFIAKQFTVPKFAFRRSPRHNQLFRAQWFYSHHHWRSTGYFGFGLNVEYVTGCTCAQLIRCVQPKMVIGGWLQRSNFGHSLVAGQHFLIVMIVPNVLRLLEL